MKRIIIKENEGEQAAEINKISQLCDAANKELMQFKADTGYGPTLEDVKSLVISNDPDFLQLNLNASLENQLDKLNITGKLMRDNQKAGANEFINQLSTKLRQLRDGARYLHNLSMKDGLLFLNKEQEEQIRDSFRHCVTSDTGKELYEKHKALAQSFSEFSKLVKEKTSISCISSGELANEFFDLDYETGNIDINSIDYERIIQMRIRRDQN